MSNVSRAFEKGETLGFMKILVDKETKKFLGASFLGLSGDELVHSILDLMYAGDAIHRSAKGGTHSPNGFRIHPGFDWQSQGIALTKLGPANSDSNRDRV